MKNSFFKITLFIGAFLCFTFLQAQNTYVPDDHFEQTLIDLGYDNILDDSVATVNISGVLTLNVSSKNITDLTGIEDFVALQSLYCYANQLTALDITQNANLVELRCYSNQLTALDVSQNSNLSVLWCNTNQLTALDVSQNPNLATLVCYDNQLTTLDVTQNLNLTNLGCHINQLTTLDITQNPNLTDLHCQANQLTSLDVTQNLNLTELRCYGNQLTTLDVSQNSNLNVLWCNTNQLTALDVSQNPNLATLVCYDNQLTTLDVTQNLNLTNLGCHINQLTTLDIAQNPNLTDLHCQANQLTSLDVTQNLNLTELRCYGNQLTTLDVSQNSNLNVLWCNTNQLTALDVSQNPNLATLVCYDNALTTLDVTQNPNLISLSCHINQLIVLDLTQNTNLSGLNCYANPDLNCIQVTDETAANDGTGIYTNWVKDETATYSENCIGALQTHVPDDNFEQALIDLGYDDILDDYILTENISSITSLNVSNRNIIDLTGIEDFAALETLYCYTNQLTNLDITQNTNLIELKCYNNQLTVLDVSQNINLTILWCMFNQLNELNVTQNTNLTALHCSDNQIAVLDVTQNTNLADLYCHKNQLTTLDISQNTSLTKLYCGTNPLGTLDVTQNPNLIVLNCSDSQLSILDVTQNVNLTHLHCQTNQLSDLDVTQNINLIQLTCNNNPLGTLDVAQNTNLTSLYCYDNQLTALNVTQNANLSNLGCYRNQLTTLDVTQNPNLTYLVYNNNQLTAVNLTQNGNLKVLGCANNQLTALDVSQQASLTNLDCQNNPDLSCIGVIDEIAANQGQGIYSNWKKDETAAYNEDCIGTLQTHVPDDNFEQALIDLGYDDMLDDYVFTENISGITSLNVSNKNIADLTGIEGFAALQTLNCQKNQLTTLDVTQNTNLTGLWCHTNQLTELDVTQNINLTVLHAAHNQLTALDITQNTALIHLYCNNNQLASLDVTQQPNLTTLFSSTNQLSTLDITQNTSLTGLFCHTNQLTALNITQNPSLEVLYCAANQLTALDVSQNTNLIDLRCGDNQLSTLDISQNTSLVTLWSQINELTVLDVTQNTALTSLWCHNNQLAALNVTQNTALADLRCDNNFNLNCIQVTDETAANNGVGIYAGWLKDEEASYSENCNAASPLSGTYTIGGVAPDFDNFTEAIDLLHENGIDGATTFLVRDGIYNERISTNEIVGASAQHTVTFRAESGNPSAVTLTSSGQYYVWRLNGTDYLSIEDITVENTHENDGRAISLTNDASHNSFSGNVFTNNFIDEKGYQYALVYDRDNYNNAYNSFINNYFVNGSYGIYSRSTEDHETGGTLITGNIFEDQYYRGTYLKYHDSPQAQNNTVSTTASDKGYRGLYFNRCDDALRISGNKFNLQTGGYGVSLSYCDGESIVTSGLIYNNFIHIGQGSDKAYGIRMYKSTYQHIYFNSVNITHSNGTTGRCYYDDNCDDLVMKNNILVNMGEGYAFSHDTQGMFTTDNNDLYTLGNVLVLWQGSFKDDLQEFQNETGQGANSLSIDPQFVSNIDLHTLAIALQEMATPIAGITTDIDGVLRDINFPDIGADELDMQGARIGHSTEESFENISNNDEFYIYPNPVENSQLNVQADLPEKESIQVKITDITGKTVLKHIHQGEKGRNEITLDVRNLNNGSFIIHITTNDQLKYFKFVIRE